MTIQTIKRMLDACYQAKRIREMLPALPSGVIPSYIHFLDVIQIMERQGSAVKISDISDYLNIPRPGVDADSKRNGRKGLSAESQCGGRRQDHLYFSDGRGTKTVGKI